MANNTNFGRIIDGRMEYAPSTLRDGNKFIIRPKAADYIRCGYLPVVDNPPTEPAPEGYHWAPIRWDVLADKIVHVYEAVHNPPALPRTFSKLKMYSALASAGLWEAFVAWLEAQTISGVNGYTAFSLAQNLTEDHPLFSPLYSAVKTALGVSDEQAEAILDAATEG